MSAAPNAPWLEAATRELVAGVHELPGVDHSLRILEYLRAVDVAALGDETPWCAAFVGWCLRQVWVPGTHSGLARSYVKWGRPMDKPSPGCLTILWRGSRAGWQGHVAFYTGGKGSTVYLLGGNQGNEVSVAAYPADRVLGHRWPV